MTLAQRRSGEILLVDADLRQPRLHELFGVRRTPGLANVLAGDAEPGEVVHRTGTPNLRVMPAGWSDGTLADLLASPRLEPTLQALAARFKHIIFDTTPLFGVSDALSLVPHVEGVVLVLRHGRAHHDAARRAVHLLGAVGTPLLGVVLNRFNPRSAGTAYYYDAPMYATSGVTATRAEAPRRGA
jgi:capsular exopolysaccharide synthesis family protein